MSICGKWLSIESDVKEEYNQESRNEAIVVRDDSEKKQKEASIDLVFNVKGVQFTMKRVEGGTFTMSATSVRDSAHSVTLDSCYIGETEVTQALWQAVMDNNPSCFKGDNLPVQNVSWRTCQKFILKLNQLTGQTFVLPTEAQWEFAARGGNLSRGYKYAGSNNLREVAWYCKNSDGKIHPVAQKQPNELGLYDMNGNVCEWCCDDSWGRRVYRGGGYASLAQWCRESHSAHESSHDDNIGLRLALVF